MYLWRNEKIQTLFVENKIRIMVRSGLYQNQNKVQMMHDLTNTHLAAKMYEEKLLTDILSKFKVND